jgi:hypothetical protein
MWETGVKVYAEENEGLLLTLSELELEQVVKEMKTDMAPMPDGFLVAFFKKFWPLVNHRVLHIVNDFILGRIDIARLNYGVISLIPKVQGVDQISQFCPIALINVIFKIVSKCFASKLDPIANRVISPNQTTFIKGRFITDGVLALQEVVHELKVKKYWDFLSEVLHAKGIDPGVVHWLCQLVKGGRTAISINGEIGPFFQPSMEFVRGTHSPPSVQLHC